MQSLPRVWVPGWFAQPLPGRSPSSPVETIVVLANKRLQDGRERFCGD